MIPLLFAAALGAAIQPAAAAPDGVQMAPPPVPSAAPVPPRVSTTGAQQLSGAVPIEALAPEHARAAVGRSLIVRYLVRQDGRVGACVPMDSVAGPLEQAICALVTARFRFTPATDGDGRPLAVIRLQRLEWTGATGSGGGALPPTFQSADEETARYLANRGERQARLSSGYVSNEDYPVSALRSEAQGTVTMRYLIGADGRVATCEISGSTGDEALDTTSCLLVMQRFRYFPAQDEKGVPRVENRMQRIVWRLPSDQPPPLYYAPAPAIPSPAP